MYEVKMYQCEHCMKRIYKHKSSATSHEKKCYWNPETKSCMSCDRFFYPNESELKVVGDNTFCTYAKDNGLNSKCMFWKQKVTE